MRNLSFFFSLIFFSNSYSQDISVNNLCEATESSFFIEPFDNYYAYQWQISDDDLIWSDIIDNNNITNSSTSEMIIYNLTIDYHNQFLRCKIDTNVEGDYLTSESYEILVNQNLSNLNPEYYSNICNENAANTLVDFGELLNNNTFTFELSNGEITNNFDYLLNLNLQNLDYDTLKVNISNDCSIYNDSLYFQIYDSIGSIQISQSQSICHDSLFSNLILDSNPVGADSQFYYQWQLSHDNLEWSNIINSTDTFIDPNFIALDSYFRLLIYSNANCDSVYSNNIYLEKYDPLSAGSLSSDQTICYSTTPDSLSFSDLPSGSSGEGDYEYQWQISTDMDTWSDIELSTGTTYSPEVLYETTYYRVRVSSLYGCGVVFTPPLTINVYDEQQVGSITGFDSICQFESPYNIEVDNEPSGGDPNYNYNWQFSPDNGATWLDVINSNSTTLPDSSLTDTTIFRLEFINQCGNLFSNSIEVFVWPLPNQVSIIGNLQPCSNSYDELYQMSSYDSNNNYEWNIQNGQELFQSDSFLLGTHWFNSNQESYLELVQTNIITGCIRETIQEINLLSGISPDKSEIVRITNSNILVCSDSSENLVYQWGYYDSSNGDTTYLNDSNERYVMLDHDFDNERYDYFVLSSFNYDQYSCSTISYYDNENEYLKYNEITEVIEIYPNPFNDYFYLLNVAEPSNIEMFDLNGLKVNIEYIPDVNLVKILDTIHSGVYILVFTNDNNVSTIKLMKQ